jgi:1,4-alpha-glucan branching enzyme
MRSAIRIANHVQRRKLNTLEATRSVTCTNVQSTQPPSRPGMRRHSESILKITAPKLAEYRRCGIIHTPIASRLVEVTFLLDRPWAQEVYLSGDFNEWSPTSLRMIAHGPGDEWAKRITLAPGRYQYKFIVDGEWIHDPEASENVPNHHGSLNSTMEVYE